MEQQGPGQRQVYRAVLRVGSGEVLGRVGVECAVGDRAWRGVFVGRSVQESAKFVDHEGVVDEEVV